MTDCMTVKSLRRAAVPAAIVLGAVLLCSCQVRGAQMAQSPLLRFFERPVGLIVFIAADGNVRLVDQKGGGSRALTADAGPSADGQVLYTAPTWSPDGRRVAFTRMTLDNASQVVEAALFTAGRDGRALVKVLSGPRLRPFYLYWSPDSRMVSLLSSVDGESSLELGLTPAGQAGGYRTLDRGSPYYWAWRADSRALITHVNTGQPGSDGERLSLLNLEPSPSSAPLKAEPGVFQAPSFSPDGKTVAYASTAEATSTLHLSAADGSADRAVATDQGGVFLEFSRDGRRLAYLAALRLQPVPLGTLSIVDIAKGLRRRTLTEQPVLEFSWSPDGRTLAFVTPDNADEIDAMFARSDSLPYVRLMGCDPATGKTWTVARFPPSRGFFTVLPFFDQYQRSSTMWSPDSRFITFTGIAADGDPAVFVSRADGNIKPRFVAAGDDAFWSLR
jgi:TolB protein